MAAAGSLAVHAIGLIVLYSLYGLLQERIFKSTYNNQHFTASSVLVLCNRLFSMTTGFTIIMFKSRAKSSQQTVLERLKPASPVYAYSTIALLNFSSTFCQYEALKYVSFTTQALAKTIKMVPVLVMGTLVYKQTHKTKQWVAAGVVLLGTFTYLTSRSDASASAAPAGSLMDGLFGGVLLLGYLSLDGLTSTTQEKLFGRNPNPSKPFADGSPVLDQMFWVNLSSSGISLIGCALGFSSTMASFRLMLSSPALMADVLLLSATSATGLIVLLNTIAAFGALTSSTIMTVRQFLSILINAGVFGNFGSIGIQGWLGVFWTAAGIFIKMDRRWDEPKKEKPVLPRNAANTDEQGMLMADRLSPEEDAEQWQPPSTPSKPDFPYYKKPAYFKQYGVPVLVPVLMAIVLSLVLPVATGQAQPSDVWNTIANAPHKLSESLLGAGDDYQTASADDALLEGGAWGEQLHAAVSAHCPSIRPNTVEYNRTQAPITALATYPRSGNTYIRGMIERATGFRTSSVYCDQVLAQTFLGECSEAGLLRKTHYPVTRVPTRYVNGPDHWKQFDRYVHLVRNPIDATYSYFHYQRSGHNHEARIDIEQINATDASAVRRYAERWVLHAQYWSETPLEGHSVRYEDLRSAPLPNLMSLLSFLLPSEDLPSLDALACVVEVHEEAEAYHSRKSQPFSAWERFTPDMRELLLEITKPWWCRMGYDQLLARTRPDVPRPVDCKSTSD